MDFFVYRTKTNISIFQFQGNRNCCYTGYPSPSTKTDSELIQEVSLKGGGVGSQVRWICKSDGTLARHIGIFVCPEGYAVLPVFGDEEFIGKEFFIPAFSTSGS